jgi:chromosomal replication initiator protein
MGENRDYSDFWSQAMKRLRCEITEQEYGMWLTKVTYKNSLEGKIVVSVPSTFHRDQIKQRYGERLEASLGELAGGGLGLEYVIGGALAQGVSAGAGGEGPCGVSEEVPAVKKGRTQHFQLRSDYTFDSFVCGEGNSFAYNAAIAIAKNPASAYNPYLIHGGVGLGKTHLIQSIGNEIHKKFTDMKVVYVTAEDFTTEFTDALQKKRMPQFKNKYRTTDVLLIDDIHFLKKHMEGTMEELFHTFNALYNSNKQMVFTCDRPVSELESLSDRLRSRFGRGLNVELQLPPYEVRCAILRKKIALSSTPIPDEVVNFIGENVQSNVRDIEAALTKLIAYSKIVRKEITLETARQQIKDIINSGHSLRQVNITVDMVKKVVAEYFGISFSDLSSKKRPNSLVIPRHIAMYITRELSELSTTEIGQEFGGRDHTTVMNACDKIEDKMKMDPTLEPTIQHLTKTIKERSEKL